MTNLPFVYALWAVNGENNLDALFQVLLESKRRGIEKIEEIARAESARLSLGEGVCLRYLRDAIRYDLGELLGAI
jgi:predicted solute-binding protein